MAKKPENVFRDSVHRHFPKQLHHEKMNNPYSSGTPDDFYSGSKSDLWVEYKFLPRVPQRAIVWPANPNQSMLTTLQLTWINDRYEDFKHSLERKVAVVVGCPDGGVILLDQEWMNQIEPKSFRDKLVPRKEIAQWIAQTISR